MKTIIIITALAALCAGCGTVRVTPYHGGQGSNPTAPGAIMETVDGFPVYYGLPPRAYRVLGRVSIDEPANLSAEMQRVSMLRNLAKAARGAGANAAVMLESSGSGFRPSGLTTSGFLVQGGTVVPMFGLGQVRNTLTAAALLVALE